MLGEFKNTREVLESFKNDTLTNARGNLKIFGFNGAKKNRKIESTGKLGKSLFGNITDQNLLFTVSFGSTENYAAIVEQGRRKGSKMPPTESIEQWIKDKPIRLQRVFVNKFGQKVNEFVAKTDANIANAAFLIARSISRKGTRATRFMTLGMQKAFDVIPTPLSNAIVNDMADLIIDNFEKRKYNGNITKRNN